MTRFFLIIDASGENYVMWDKEGVPPTDPHRLKPIEVERMPGPFERFDRKLGAFVRNDEAAIDERHGADAIAKAHARKAIEADLILSGLDLPRGLLAAEAKATGQPVKDLAKAVQKRSSDDVAAEVERIMAKRVARGL